MSKFIVKAKCGPSTFICRIETDNKFVAAMEGKKAAYCFFAKKHNIDVSDCKTLSELTQSVSKLPYRVQLVSVNDETELDEKERDKLEGEAFSQLTTLDEVIDFLCD
jgi:hypothetical protein